MYKVNETVNSEKGHRCSHQGYFSRLTAFASMNGKTSNQLSSIASIKLYMIKTFQFMKKFTVRWSLKYMVIHLINMCT